MGKFLWLVQAQWEICISDLKKGIKATELMFPEKGVFL